MYVIEAPYHLDEALSGALLPLPADETVRVPLARDGEVWDSLAVVFGAVARAVSRAVSARQVPVVVSGDCSTALGTVAGLQQADLDPAVVWFDAHGDVQTLETSASGYLGGLPVRMLTGYRPELLTGRLGLRPVPEHRIVLAGARDLDPPEVAYLERARIQCWEVARLTTGVLPSGPLYIHLDLDVLDPAEVDGLQFPVAGGLIEALEAVHAAGLIHRDLKPANVLLAEDGPRLIDFFDSHLGGARTLILPGRIGPATRESAWKRSASGSSHDGPAFR